MIYLIGYIVVLWLSLKFTCFVAALASDLIGEVTDSDFLAGLAWLAVGGTMALAFLICFLG